MIIPFFIPNQGCPQRCIFCNARALADVETPDNKVAFQNKVTKHLRASIAERREIAFYGANFTGMAKDKQECLLGWAATYQKEGFVDGIRISTRPDYISPEIVDFLLKYGVGVVEIGAQSLDDDVLVASGRGHKARDVSNAMALLKAKGIKTSLHLMAGLPRQTPASFWATLEDAVAIKPDMVRIHPTLVFADTPLAKLYQSGAYSPLSLEDAVFLCKAAARLFIDNDIKVIRLGLQISADAETPLYPLAGPYHPAFGALIYTRLIEDAAEECLAKNDCRSKSIIIGASPKDMGFLKAHRQELIERFELKSLEIQTNKQQKRGIVMMEKKEGIIHV